MVARTITIVILILTLTLISDTRSSAAPAAEMVYIVNSDQDTPDKNPGDHICLTIHDKCTLRAAIQEANRDLTVSRIKFASKMTIVDPTLEGLTEPFTVIDASDRWDGSWPSGRPGVIIGGGLYSNGVLLIQGNYAAVYGIEFFGGGSKGIVVYGSNGTIIGGTEPGQRNAFTTSYHASSTSMGIEVTNNATKTDIRSNYFGTFDGINPIVNPGEYGVYLRTSGNTIRENIIVGQTVAGINCWVGGHNAIMDNYIGTDEYQSTAIPNQVGIAIYDSDENQIGPFNVIVGNTLEGVKIQMSDNNLIVGNQIGKSSMPNGGDGVKLISSTDTRIGIYIQNNIDSNKGHGIALNHSHDSQIKLNSVYGNSNSGVYLENATGNTVGGVNAYHWNVLSKNGTHGVYLGSGANNNTVSGNFIGFDSSGAFDHGNSNHGVLIENGASDNQIGGINQGEGNWIGFNNGSGIYLSGSTTTGNVLEGNIIGAPVNWGWEAPNGNHGIGIYNGANGNWVGWFNTILASGWSGVVVVNSSNNVIWFNNIGTDGADIHWGNKFYGVHVFNSPGNLITSNNIHHNGLNGGEPGVLIEQSGSLNNFISLNSITQNGGLGIELKNGGNASQPAPTITSGSCTSTIAGTACPGCIVEIFSDSADEGRIFEGSVNADASSGAFSWDGNPAGPNLTATASNDFLGSTSQFSAPYNIGVCNNPPTAAFTYAPTKVNTCAPVAFDASSSSDVEDPISALQVRWDWENDGTFDTTLSHQKTAQHIFNSPGGHTVRLEVQDTGGLTDSATVQITADACLSTYLPLVVR